MKKLLSLLGLLTMSATSPSALLAHNDKIISSDLDFDTLWTIMTRDPLYSINNFDSENKINIENIKKAIVIRITGYDINFVNFESNDFTITIKSIGENAIVYVEHDICQVNDLSAIINGQQKVAITITSTSKTKQTALTFENFIFIKKAQSHKLDQWLAKYNEQNPALLTMEPKMIISAAVFKEMLWNACFGHPLNYIDQKDNFSVTIDDNNLLKLQSLNIVTKQKIEINFFIAVINTFTSQQSGNIFQKQDQFEGSIFFQVKND